MEQIIRLSEKILLNRRIVGSLILLVVLVTLVVDVMGLVHPCPYCRTQRFALGILAIIMMMKAYHVLLARYAAAVIGMFGLIVGVMQNFNHIKKINKGEFDWAGLWIGHPWILSGLAVMALTWQLLLIFDVDKISRKAG